MRFSGWVWVAAVSLVGIEVFEVLFGTFVLAPELLPVALVVMALAYLCRERLRRVRRWLVLRLRSARARRRHRDGRSTIATLDAEERRQ